MERRTAFKVTEYSHFGGKSFDFVTHASMFRDDNPYNFGVMNARLFSSELGDHMIDKFWTYWTMAQKNFYVIPGGKDEFTWEVVGDNLVDYKVVALVETPGSQLGKNNSTFRIVLDKPWLHEPIALKTDDDNAPLLKIIGRGEPYGNGIGTIYTVKLQDGDPNSWIPTSLVDVGATMIRASTPVGDEENYDFGSDEYTSGQVLRGVCGQVANGIEFTDKFVRAEAAAAKKGTKPNMSYKFGNKEYNDALFSGYVYNTSLRGENGEKITKGVFISAAEKRLLERTMSDREMICEFGRLEYDTHHTTNRKIKVAPGFRQIAKEGQYFPHGGSFTLDQLYDFLQQVFIRRKGFKNRRAVLRSGTGGINYISNLIAQNAAGIQVVEPGFLLGKRTDGGAGVHENELWMGGQFTQIKLPMGIVVDLVYDPKKDDAQTFRTKAPNSYLPLESFQIDVLEFGKTENAPKGATGENITMVMQDGVESYFSICNIVDIRRGPITDGSNAYAMNKTCGIYHELPGSLAVWDSSAIGRIEWVPAS